MEGGREKSSEGQKEGMREGEKEPRTVRRWELTDPRFSSSIYGPSSGKSKGMKEGVGRKEVERKERGKMLISAGSVRSAVFLK